MFDAVAFARSHDVQKHERVIRATVLYIFIQHAAETQPFVQRIITEPNANGVRQIDEHKTSAVVGRDNGAGKHECGRQFQGALTYRIEYADKRVQRVRIQWICLVENNRGAREVAYARQPQLGIHQSVAYFQIRRFSWPSDIVSDLDGHTRTGVRPVVQQWQTAPHWGVGRSVAVQIVKETGLQRIKPMDDDIGARRVRPGGARIDSAIVIFKPWA